jgi:hypothetical protein
VLGDGAGAAYSLVAAERFWKTVALGMRDEFFADKVKLPARK